MANITLKVLNEQIDIDGIASDARLAWEKKQQRRRTLIDRIIQWLPRFMVIAFVVFYALSAPHTVGLLNRITPDWGWLSPIGIELLLVVLGAFREAGQRSKQLSIMLYTLLGVAILINVFGGIIAIIHTSVGLTDANAQTIIAQFTTLPAYDQIALLLAIPIGLLIPITGKFTGEMVIKIAMGKIQFELESDDDRWWHERFEVVRSALLRAALAVGAGHATAGNWARKTVEQLYPEDIGIDVGMQAVGQIVMTKPHTGVRAQREAGFLAYAGQSGTKDRTGQQDSRNFENSAFARYDTQRTAIDTKDSPGQDLSGTGRMTKERVVEWLQDNGSRWRDMSNEDISVEITGATNGYKTVQRALRDLGLRR